MQLILAIQQLVLNGNLVLMADGHNRFEFHWMVHYRKKLMKVFIHLQVRVI